MAPVFMGLTPDARAKAEACAIGATERTGVRHVVVEEWSETWETEAADNTPVGRAHGIGSCSASKRRFAGEPKPDPSWGAWPSPGSGGRVEPKRGDQ